METTVKTLETKVAEVTENKKKPAPAEPKSWTLRYLSGSETLLLRATRTATGWRTEAVHNKDKKNSRGLTADHATKEAAGAAIKQMAAGAEKAGWKPAPTGRGGFHRPADQFAAIPKPGSAKK